MPLRLNIGLSKKVGLPDYGSLGASANLELELDSGAVSDPDRLRQQVRYLFGLAKASVEEELNQQQAALRQLRGVRFESHGYVAVLSLDGRVLVSPTRPQSEGLLVSQLNGQERRAVKPRPRRGRG